MNGFQGVFIPFSFKLINVGMNEFDEEWNSIGKEFDIFDKPTLKEGGQQKEKSVENTSIIPATDPWNNWSKPDEWAKRFKDSQSKFESYSRETRTTTNITRNPDGSIYKETVTTERLPDGTSKTTRIIDTTHPANSGQPHHEEIVTTTPPESKIASAETTWDRPRVTPVEDWERLQTESPSGKIEKPMQKENGKKEGNWTWWFWSKK